MSKLIGDDSSGVGNLPPLVVDLHAHYAMRWMPKFYWSGFALLKVAVFGGTAKVARARMDAATMDVEILEENATPHEQIVEARQLLVRKQHQWQILSNRLKAIFFALMNICFNYATLFSGAAIRPERMRKGMVHIAFSVLLDPFDEFFDKYPGWPAGTPYFHLLQQMDFVEKQVKDRVAIDGVWIPRKDQLNDAVEKARKGERIALIHCIEGGHHLGDLERDIKNNVAVLAKRGVAYVTLAHLFFRRLATSANAFPIPDWAYHRRFPQGNMGLTDLGTFAVRQLAANRILIDVCHMSERAIEDTLCVLDRYDEQNPQDAPTPIIATHMACRIGEAEYNLSVDTIKNIIKRKGLLGVIFSRHWMREHLNTREFTWEDTCQVVTSHLEKIRVNGDPNLTCAAIGSDHDGFIKHALWGLEHPGKMLDLSGWILDNYPSQAEGILWKNAIRVLRKMWRQPEPPS